MNNKQTTILVTGANGQMGNELQMLAPEFADYHFLFVSKEDLNIADASTLENYFSEHPQMTFTVVCAVLQRKPSKK